MVEICLGRAIQFVNLGIDVFTLTPPAEHDVELVDGVLERAKAHADVGARGLFAPLLQDAVLIERLRAASSLPVTS